MKYFGGKINDPLNPGYNYDLLTLKESKLYKNKNKFYELNLDLSKAKLMGSESDPDDAPYSGSGFFIEMNS